MVESVEPRADTFAKLKRILATSGVHEALRFLNSRTPHRFTGVCRFDGEMLRNLHLVDVYEPKQVQGADAPMEETYCSIVGRTRERFFTEDTRTDPRLSTHPARETVVSYCGVLLLDEQGNPFGTLCHFDLMPCDVPHAELPLLERAALVLMSHMFPSDAKILAAPRGD